MPCEIRSTPSRKPRRPEANGGEAEQDQQAGSQPEGAGDQHHPSVLLPMGETQHAPNDARRQQKRTQEIGQDQGAGSRLGEQQESKAQIERTEQDLPQEPAPSLGPVGMKDLERADTDDRNPDQLDADERGEHDVAESEDARGVHHDAKERADPQRRSARSPDVGPVVIDCHAILPDPRDNNRHAWDGRLQLASPASDETLSNGAGIRLGARIRPKPARNAPSPGSVKRTGPAWGAARHSRNRKRCYRKAGDVAA